MEVSNASCIVKIGRYDECDVLVFEGPLGMVILGEETSYDEVLLAIEKVSGKKVGR